ncbi:MAG: hypothetical protein M3O67_06265 [Bacteroidota bacterium]|nr:hypothetical protein [Bacteroidota bacterium]
MKNKIISVSLLLLFFTACNNEDQKTSTQKSENDIDAARNFIESALKGDYTKARTFIVSDSINLQYIDAFERNYKERMNPDDKRGYREASINIHAVRPLNDSTTIVSYSNSFKKVDDSLMVVRIHNQWLVDLKYSFYQKVDSAQ